MRDVLDDEVSDELCDVLRDELRNVLVFKRVLQFNLWMYR